MPSKTEAAELSNLILTAKSKLVDFMQRQNTIGELEQEILRQNNEVDESLIFMTISESVAILALAIVETLVLRRFISKKELF